MIELVGSITDLGAAGGRLVVTGSHGGDAVGRHALRKGAGALIFHDAGVGLDGAGIATLALFEAHGRPAAAIDHRSARIGDAEDMLRRGIVSHANRLAAERGVRPGDRAAAAAALLETVPPGDPVEPALLGAASFRRREFVLEGRRVAAPLRVVILDSASDVRADDGGAIIVAGSHGGLPGNSRHRALKAVPLLAFFNDAGIGIEEAGIRRLPALAEEGIAAACVSAATARIGDGESTYADGLVSHLNEPARAIGIRSGHPVRELLRLIDWDATANPIARTRTAAADSADNNG